MSTGIMDAVIPGHPRWSEFVERLTGPEGCNFREANPGHQTWDCAGGMDKTKATAILRSMGAPEECIATSMHWYEEHGGHCDCEIIFNCTRATQQTHHVADKEEFKS